MRPLLSNPKQYALLRRSLALISPRWDELIIRSYARFIAISLEVVTPAAGAALQRANEQILAAMRNGSRSEKAQRIEFADPAVHPRHLAILANAILTTASEILDDEWSVEIESLWDEALHNLIAQMIRARVAVRR